MTGLTIGFLLALGSATCWAVLDVARKQLGRGMTAMAAVAAMMLFNVPILLPMLIAGELLGADAPQEGLLTLVLSGFPSISLAYLLPALASVTLNLFANYLFLRSVQLSPLSLTAPYLAFTPVFTALVALVTIGEVPTNWGWAGILVVCVGAFCMNPGDSAHGVLAPLKALWSERGSFYMLIVALLWSFTPVLDKAASGVSSPTWHTLFLAACVGVLFAGACIVRDGGAGKLWEETRAVPALLFACAFLAVGAMILQLGSYDYIDVAYVETVKRALGVTIAILAGYFLFGERDIWRRLFGAAVMCIGVAMILMGAG
ncbi:MAG: EamA family transporter [Bradymonadaceae bacterium]|nr:EamA family transporter [Lujinxingiaceae bacterium]